MSDLCIKSVLKSCVNKDGILVGILDHFTVKMIDFEGSQGKVGILKHKQTGEKVIFKIPVEMSFVIRQESTVMDFLNGSRKFSPHFCESYGLYKVKISSDPENPFKNGTQLYEVLFSEYIKDSISVNDHTQYENTKVIYSLILQTLLAIEIGRRKYGLVHYDLHTDNVLTQKCSKNSLFLYKLGNCNKLIPTFGYTSILIDFGFSYVKGKQIPLYSGMEHTDSGYLTCLFDPYYDTRVFLMNTSYDLEKLGSKREKTFRSQVLNYYANLQIDKVKGWDIKKGQYSAADMIVYTIGELEESKYGDNGDNGESRDESFFITETYLAVSIVHSLITLPLKNNKNGNFRPYYINFVKEFAKFEKTVRSDENKARILMQIVDSARNFQGKPRETYYNFKEHFLSNLSLEFYTPPPDVNYQSMLINLFNMVDCIETVYFRVMKDISEQKKEQYRNSIDNMDIFNHIERTYSSPYEINPETKLYIWDIVNESSRKITNFSEKFCEKFNKASQEERVNLMISYSQKKSPY